MAALLLGVAVRLNRRRTARPDAHRQRQLHLSGFLGITVYFVLENVGVDLSTASDASLIVATYPLMTMLLELAARMPLPRVTGYRRATPGAFLVVRNGAQFGGSSRWTGDVRLLVGGPAWAGYNVLGKPASAGREAMSVTYYQTLAGAAGFLLASLLEAGDWRMPGATASCPLGYLAVACSVGGFLLYNYGLRRMPSSVAVNILNPVPAFGVIGAVLINGESVRPAQAVGGAVIVAGVALSMVERGPRAAARPDASEHEPSGPPAARAGTAAGPVPDEPVTTAPFRSARGGPRSP
ncbi:MULTISPECIES: DMT family transporter [unclassified Streptomyces]|uniref:DMT family transporter n=2 Tax=unclassified Streptomyces TaxID=2593676 RepID=UPI000858EDE8|nr:MULTISPECIES: DMT family transporter [unclassified Streptomyces]MYR68372.1 EamA family transporter [Streptomyces sp. SID4939]SCM10719.1 Permease of the drug/metabolite transporter (DMT) superfamily [Streptomyces sp. DpondAA-F4]